MSLEKHHDADTFARVTAKLVKLPQHHEYLQLNLPLHCDGARIFNAAEQVGISAASLVEPCDSVSVCLSKGLGAPVGSVIVGKKTFIAR